MDVRVGGHGRRLPLSPRAFPFFLLSHPRVCELYASRDEDDGVAPDEVDRERSRSEVSLSFLPLDLDLLPPSASPLLSLLDLRIWW